MGVPKAGEEEGITLDGAGVGAAWNMPALRKVVDLSDRFILFSCNPVSVKCSGIGKTIGKEDAYSGMRATRREYVSRKPWDSSDFV